MFSGLCSRVARRYQATVHTPLGVALTQCQQLHGLLHAISLLHRSIHWQASGPQSYNDHLLFERLYNPIPEEIDGLAERMVQVFGVGSVTSLGRLVEDMRVFLDGLGGEDVGPDQALDAERYLLQRIAALREVLTEARILSIGFDDFLAGVASTHDTHVYLLQQRTQVIPQRAASEGMWTRSTQKTAVRNASGAPSAEGHFFDKPRTREVREFAQSGAISNDYGVAERAATDNVSAPNIRKVLEEVASTPPTVAEILELPGARMFSTLNRYVVETEVKGVGSGVPQGHDEVPKHPKLR